MNKKTLKEYDERMAHVKQITDAFKVEFIKMLEDYRKEKKFTRKQMAYTLGYLPKWYRTVIKGDITFLKLSEIVEIGLKCGKIFLINFKPNEK